MFALLERPGTFLLCCAVRRICTLRIQRRWDKLAIDKYNLSACLSAGCDGRGSSRGHMRIGLKVQGRTQGHEHIIAQTFCFGKCDLTAGRRRFITQAID
jgi:hypothetical protein